MPALECFFPADHPAAEGHFPGDPIIPGAVVLSEAVRAVEAAVSTAPTGRRMRSAKFLHPVRPGDRMRIEWSRIAGKEALRIAGSVQGLPVLSAELECREANFP